MAIRVLAILLLAAVPAAAGAALSMADLADREAVIEHASHVGDVRYLDALSRELSEEKGRGAAAPLVPYYAALASYRAAELDDDIDFNVGVLLDRCIENARAALKIDETLADAMALIGACHGLAASRQPLSAIIAGNFSARELKRALALDPENPRVRMLNAVTLLRRFEDKTRRVQARSDLVAAISAFERPEPGRPELPSWGEEHAHAWLAEALRLDGDLQAARDHLEQSRLLSPPSSRVPARITALAR